MNADHRLNVIVLGEMGVGKTSLLMRYKLDMFRENMPSTQVVDVLHKDIVVNDKRIKLLLWDTAGQDRFRTIVRQYFRHAQGVLLVYDTTDITTFHKLSSWLDELRSLNETAQVLIVGNKSDEVNRKTVSISVVKRFAEQEGLEFMEASAKTGENMEKVFDCLVRKMLEASGVLPKTAPIQKSSPQNENASSQETAAQHQTEVCAKGTDSVIVSSRCDSNDTIKLAATPNKKKKCRCSL